MAKPRKPQVGVPEVGGNNVPIIIGSIVAVLVVAIIAVLLTQNAGSDEESGGVDTIEWQSVTATGESLPPYSGEDNSSVNEAVGSTAPTLTGKNFINEPVTIGPGKPKVVVFLAHWCPHCQKELPLIADWLKANKSRFPNVEFYGVATATDNRRPNFPPSDWLDKEGFTGTVLVDDRPNSASSAYGLTGYPFIVFLDKDNKVVGRTSGELPIDEFETRVNALTGS